MSETDFRGFPIECSPHRHIREAAQKQRAAQQQFERLFLELVDPEMVGAMARTNGTNQTSLE